MLHTVMEEMGLSARLMLGVAAGFLALFVALGFLSLQALDQSTRVILDGEQLRARMVAGELDRFITQAFYELEKATDFAAFDPTAANLEAEQHMLAHAYGRLGSFSRGVSFLDVRGRIVLTEPFRPESIGVDLSQADHIRAVQNTAKRSVSAPHFDLREGRPVVALTVPVRDRSGRVIAMLSGLVDIMDSPIGTALRTATAQGGTAHGDVITRDGIVVASTEEYHIMNLGEHPDFYLRRMTDQEPGVETVAYVTGGREVDRHVMAFEPLTSVPWGLSLGASAAETFAPVTDFRRTLIFTGLLFFFAALTLTLAGAQLLVRPVQSMTHAARRMADGDLSQPIWVPEGGEIGLLASSLESMRVRLASSINEITQLNNTLEQRVDARTVELAERNQELAATATIAARVAGSLDLEEVLREGLDGVMQVAKAEGGAIWLKDPRSGDLHLRVHRNLPAEFLEAEKELACGECLCGAVAERDAPLLVNDLRAAPLAVRPACRHAGFRSLLLVPLSSKGEARGVFLLGGGTGTFDEHDMRLVTAVAHHLSLAVESARLFQELQQKEAHLRHLLTRIISVQEEERKRIARELHDETGQSLTALIMTLEGTAEGLPRSESQLRGRLKRAEEMLRMTLDDVRKIILDLRPSALDDLGLVAALRRYASARLEPVGVSSEVKAVGYPEGAQPQIDLVLFRIGQEAINNVARHAGASNVRIEVRGQPGQSVELDVVDNGKGFDWAEVEQSQDPMKGIGLMGMQERATLFGGSCEVVSRPGQGTRVHVSLPLLDREAVPHG